ncbi:hypothetical protein AAFC00_002380 [Neodothiora populina]
MTSPTISPIGSTCQATGRDAREVATQDKHSLAHQQQLRHRHVPGEEENHSRSSTVKRKRDCHAECDTDPANGRRQRRQAKHGDFELANQHRRQSQCCKSSGASWTEQDLRRIVYKVIASPSLCATAIHPTAAVVADSIVVPSVPVHIFKKLQSLLPSIPATVSWKLEFFDRPASGSKNFVPERKRNKKGHLTVTMPTHIHKAFIAYSHDIADQLYRSSFLPPQYKRTKILQSGSTQLKNDFKGLVPDAGIAFFDVRRTFLVLEVAYSQKEANALQKAQRYLLNTNGRIKVVVLVIVTKKSGNVAIPSLSGSASQIPEDTLSPDTDTVHVHVHKAIQRPPDILTGERSIDRLQIFPDIARNDTFTITWADINWGSWTNFCEGAKIRPNTPEPICQIDFSALVTIARDLAGQADDFGDGAPLYQPVYTELGTPCLKKETYLDSSSPAPHLSSGGTLSSNEERKLDPDYQPSDGSYGSYDSP